MKIFKKHIWILLLTNAALSALAQQDPQYTHYMYNMNIVNPAYAGSADAMQIGVLGRRQWLGVDGAPRSITAFIHAPVGKQVGLGLSVLSDKIGPIDETHVYTDFSYTIQISNKGKLAFGLKAGLTFQNIGLLSLTQVAPNDPLFAENVNKTFMNMGIGMFYYTEKLYLGASIPNMLEHRHFKRKSGLITKASEQMHYFLTGGYVFDISRTVKLKPSILMKFAANTPLSTDISANFLFHDRFEIGASYRWGDAISGLINFKVTESLRLGYAYDHTLSNLGIFSSGTHEAFVLFDFSFSNNNVKSPRFF